MQNNEIYSVYMHIFPNGKRYVGITSQQISRRWREGKGYKSQEMFTRAINKYGWDNIQHIILYDKLTKEQAEEKKRILDKIKIPSISVCEDVTEHYNYWKENYNPNKEDCCNLRGD